MNDEGKNLSKVILKSNEDIFDIRQQLANSLSKIEWPKIELLKIEWPKIEWPKIEWPKIEWPTINIDIDRIKSITEHNSKCGWTLTSEIGFGDYLNDDLIDMSLKDIDQYFYTYYTKNDWEYLEDTQKEILEYIDPKWCEIIEDCFESFSNDKYKVIIPTLISIIEGEISVLLESKLVGYRLISKLESKTLNDEDTFKKIAVFSLYHFLSEELFSTHHFEKNRKELINRNWILHGRDDPKYWKKVDALRLINVLSTVQFVKRYINIDTYEQNQ